MGRHRIDRSHFEALLARVDQLDLLLRNAAPLWAAHFEAGYGYQDEIGTVVKPQIFSARAPVFVPSGAEHSILASMAVPIKKQDVTDAKDESIIAGAPTSDTSGGVEGMVATSIESDAKDVKDNNKNGMSDSPVTEEQVAQLSPEQCASSWEPLPTPCIVLRKELTAKIEGLGNRADRIEKGILESQAELIKKTDTCMKSVDGVRDAVMESMGEALTSVISDIGTRFDQIETSLEELPTPCIVLRKELTAKIEGLGSRADRVEKDILECQAELIKKTDTCMKSVDGVRDAVMESMRAALTSVVSGIGTRFDQIETSLEELISVDE